MLWTHGRKKSINQSDVAPLFPKIFLFMFNGHSNGNFWHNRDTISKLNNTAESWSINIRKTKQWTKCLSLSSLKVTQHEWWQQKSLFWSISLVLIFLWNHDGSFCSLSSSMSCGGRLITGQFWPHPLPISSPPLRTVQIDGWRLSSWIDDSYTALMLSIRKAFILLPSTEHWDCCKALSLPSAQSFTLKYLHICVFIGS